MMMMISFDFNGNNEDQKQFYRNLDFVMTMIAFAFVMRFTLQAADPAFAVVDQMAEAPIYETLRMPIDVLYNVTGFLQVPVQVLLEVIGNITGLFPNESFPIMDVSGFGQWVQDAVNRLPMWARQGIPQYMFTAPPESWMPGFFEWTSLIAAGFYMFLRPVISNAYMVCRNWMMNQIIERQYVEEKQRRFREELQRKNDEIRVAQNQSQNLKSEISMLNNSVVTDELTQAFNRRFFSEKIRELFNQQKSNRQLMTVMMVDIDHFKNVNDTYGHLVGDEVLQIISRTLKKFTPKSGFCCRYGGEEFSILLPQMALEQATSTAEIIRNEVIRLAFPSEPALKTTVSIGIATADFASQNVQRELHHYEDLIKHADDALYQAKTTGRNRVIQRRIS